MKTNRYREVLRLEFPQRLANLRKQRGLSQQELADAIGMHVNQIKRYEKGTSQPPLEVLKKIALAMNVSANLLVFGIDAQGPHGDLLMQFEAVQNMDEEEKQAVRVMLDGIILRHTAKRLAKASSK